MTDRSPTDLEILFPGETLQLTPDLSVTIKPLTMDRIPLVIQSIFRINEMVEADLTTEQIAGALVEDMLAIAPYCMDIDIRKLPVAFAPQIIKALFRVNVTPDMLGNWKALSTDMETLKGVIGLQEKEKSSEQTEELPGEPGQSDSPDSSQVS